MSGEITGGVSPHTGPWQASLSKPHANIADGPLTKTPNPYGVVKTLQWRLSMSGVTYVSFVPKRKCSKLRATLRSDEASDLQWHERRKWFGSEFYFVGPPELARKTHAFVTRWLNELI